jgi:F420-non-reducing hydrogenase small subunit
MYREKDMEPKSSPDLARHPPDVTYHDSTSRVTRHASRPRIAVYWTGSCGGCDVSFLEVGEAVVEILSHVEIAFWPALVDVKRSDLEALPPGYIDFSLINGVIRTEENYEMAKLLRAKSRYIVAYGACAHLGGVPSLANNWGKEEIFAVVFGPGFRPGSPVGEDNEAQLPDLIRVAVPLEEVVRVDYAVPGCPPPAPLIDRFFGALLSGEMPEPPYVFANVKALCEECPRERHDDRRIERIHRPHEIVPDPKECLLEQGLICLGPVTCGGCDALCPDAGMPCTGCLGPTPEAGDPGAAMLSALASLVRFEDEGEQYFAKEDEALEALADPLGTFYMYSFGKYRRVR